MLSYSYIKKTWNVFTFCHELTDIFCNKDMCKAFIGYGLPRVHFASSHPQSMQICNSRSLVFIPGQGFEKERYIVSPFCCSSPSAHFHMSKLDWVLPIAFLSYCLNQALFLSLSPVNAVFILSLCYLPVINCTYLCTLWCSYKTRSRLQAESISDSTSPRQITRNQLFRGNWKFKKNQCTF